MKNSQGIHLADQNTSVLNRSIQPILHALERGQPVILPTETVYGIAARADDPKAIAKIFALKQRPSGKSLPLCVSSAAQSAELVRLNPRAKALTAQFWPGPLTVIATARPHSGVTLSAIASDGSLALRHPDAPWVDALAAAGWDIPLVLTSANISGAPNPRCADSVRRAFGNNTPVMIDSGPCPDNIPSTIIDTRSLPLRVLREGALPPEQLAGHSLTWTHS